MALQWSVVEVFLAVAAKKDGSWNFFDDVQKGSIPDDLSEALSDC
ncbi:MAG: hypothetical protein AAGC71_08355 [Pseudomonadota bacterium]